MDDRTDGPAVDGERIGGDVERPAGRAAGAPDAGADTGGPDTGGSDTGGPDTGGPDTGGPDTGAGVGADTADDAGAALLDEPVDPMAALTAERDEYLDALRRLQAEFDNYRKRVAKQQAEEADRRAARLIIELLPVLDALDLAASHLGEPLSDDGRALVASAALLNDVLRKEGLERIDPVGEEFDPTEHEAVGHLPAEEAPDIDEMEGTAGAPGAEEPAGEAAGEATGEATGEPAGEAPGEPVSGADLSSGATGSGATRSGAASTVVAQVMRAGYRYRGTVVRPAMVLVRG